jgi:hypothetical protein
MRRPHGGAEGHTGYGEPGGRCTARKTARNAECALEQAGARVGAKTAEDGEDDEQRVVVLIGDAEEELLHLPLDKVRLIRFPQTEHQVPLEQLLPDAGM